MMKKILIAINFDEGLYQFRKELLEALFEAGYEVHISLPDGEYIEKLRKMGCIFHETPMRRRGKNPVQELSLICRYRSILKAVKPEVVLTYTIKPNLYAGFLCGCMKIPYITTITGLGTAVEGNGLLQKITGMMYRLAMQKVSLIFFQNQENEKVFARQKIALGKHALLPGSGVNLEKFQYLEFPEKKAVEFLFISRILREKGIEEFLDMAVAVKKKYPEVIFRILGFLEDDYEGTERFARLQQEGVICFAGNVENVIPYLADSQCTVHPSYYPEGMSNVCLESAACGRPVITTDRPGCRETIKDGVTGFLVEEKNSRDLTEKVEAFLGMPVEERAKMGRQARNYMEERFDRKIVVTQYLKALEKVRSTNEFI